MFHQISTRRLQLVQQQSHRITGFHQTSPRLEIWFGTQVPGSKVADSNPVVSVVYGFSMLGFRTSRDGLDLQRAPYRHPCRVLLRCLL